MDGGPVDAPGAVCRELTQTCSKAARCCGHDAAGMPRAVCTAFGESTTYVCRPSCRAHDECVTGCCEQLPDEVYGVCVPEEACTSYLDVCLDGLDAFCLCSELGDNPCSDEVMRSGVLLCNRAVEPLYSDYVCMAELAPENAESCAAALEQCFSDVTN